MYDAFHLEDSSQYLVIVILESVTKCARGLNFSRFLRKLPSELPLNYGRAQPLNRLLYACLNMTIEFVLERNYTRDLFNNTTLPKYICGSPDRLFFS